MGIVLQYDHYFIFLVRYLGTFFNIKCISYLMVMVESILALSRNFTYWMAYDNLMFLRHHKYYINLDVRHHFFIVGHSYFPSISRAVSHSRV